MSHDYVNFHTPLKDNYDFGVLGRMPPEHVYKPGDLVTFHNDPNIVGLVISRVPQETKVQGLAFAEPQGISTCMIDFYTIVWSTGKIKTAGAHASWQLKPYRL